MARRPLLFCLGVLLPLLLLMGEGAGAQQSSRVKVKPGVTPACTSLAKSAKNEAGCVAYENSICDIVARKCGGGLCAALSAASCSALAAPPVLPPGPALLLPPEDERTPPIYLTATNSIRLPENPDGPGAIAGYCSQALVPNDSQIRAQCGYDKDTRRFLSRLECPEGWVAMQAVCIDKSSYPTSIPSITFRDVSNCEFALPDGADHTTYKPVHNLACARA